MIAKEMIVQADSMDRHKMRQLRTSNAANKSLKLNAKCKLSDPTPP